MHYENASKDFSTVSSPSVLVLQNQAEQMTCGENLERKIAEQKERLAMLEAAMEEMKATGLYNVKISTLRETMGW